MVNCEYSQVRFQDLEPSELFVANISQANHILMKTILDRNGQKTYGAAILSPTDSEYEGYPGTIDPMMLEVVLKLPSHKYHIEFEPLHSSEPRVGMNPNPGALYLCGNTTYTAIYDNRSAAYVNLQTGEIGSPNNPRHVFVNSWEIVRYIEGTRHQLLSQNASR